MTLEAIEWPSELHVTDVDTIEIQVRFRDSPQEVTGLRVRWQSMNEDVLHLVPANPTGVGREDTLAAQLRAVVTGRSGGSGVVHVAVDAGSGFDPAESTFVIPVTQKWMAVSAGKAHTCGITVDSVAYCWGGGGFGKLGTGLSSSRKPARVVALGDFKFVAVSAGDESTCGIIRERAAFCWGSNAGGRLGNGDPNEISRSLPTPVSGTFFSSVDVGSVVCGLDADLSAFCWGNNVDRQLGQAPSLQPLDSCLFSPPSNCSRTPRRVSARVPAPTSYRRVVVGDHHVCGISQLPDSLLAFCWGTGASGALGNASVTASDTAVPVSGSMKFRVLAAGGDHTCGITTSAETYCWGANAKGQLGHGDTVHVTTPGIVTPGAFGAFDSLTAGGKHTCALTSQGAAFCWGLDSSGQLGDGDSTVQRSPVQVSDSLRFTALSAGGSHTCGVTSNGSLYCWGRGAEGQLGAGPADVAKHLKPNRVVEP